MPKTAKAYSSKSFLSSTAARPLRILSEYLEPKSRFDHYKVEDTIVFYGSARIVSAEQAERDLKAAREAGEDPARAEAAKELSRYYEATRELAYRLTEWSKGLGQGERRFVICSGGGPGIMEAANKGASQAKGLNVGLNISLPMEESYNPHITRELQFEFHYFFMRKFWFAYLAKAAVVMPGGFGTLDELFEVLTLIQTLKIKKRLPIVLFGSEFWHQVIDFEALANHGVIDESDLDLFFRTDSVDQAFEFITGELTEHTLASPGATL